MLRELTGIPTVATLPMWWHHGLPEEDGMYPSSAFLPLLPGEGGGEGSPARRSVTVAVIAYPRVSNLDEFQPLKNVSGVRLKWVRSPAELAELAAAFGLLSHMRNNVPPSATQDAPKSSKLSYSNTIVVIWMPPQKSF